MPGYTLRGRGMDQGLGGRTSSCAADREDAIPPAVGVGKDQGLGGRTSSCAADRGDAIPPAVGEEGDPGFGGRASSRAADRGDAIPPGQSVDGKALAGRLRCLGRDGLVTSAQEPSQVEPEEIRASQCPS
jgi:hypothetical protein